MKVCLIQPGYPYGRPQTYLPGGLMNLGSRLMSIGATVGFVDLNHDELESDAALESIRGADFLGLTVLGPPYIPTVIELIFRIRALGFYQSVLLGGEGVARLQPEDVRAWFGGLSDVVVVQSNLGLERALGLGAGTLPAMEQTSMVPMLRLLSDEAQYRYLSREFCLYLSQGCIFKCKFCAACKGQKEIYRDMTCLREEVVYIAGFLKQHGCHDLTAYLSNLDIFQSAGMLDDSVKLIFEACCAAGIKPDLRGLATARFAYRACSNDSGLMGRLRAFGLHTVAFGADGANEFAWKREGKGHNSISELQWVVHEAQIAGVEPELLMVIGFPEDGLRIMWDNLRFSLVMAKRGAVIRPYLAKSRTPSGRWAGTEGLPLDDGLSLRFREHPELLVRTDYAMLGSSNTHPNVWQRWLSNTVYLLIVLMLVPFGLCPTSPLLAPSRGKKGWLARKINALMPHDR